MILVKYNLLFFPTQMADVDIYKGTFLVFAEADEHGGFASSEKDARTVIAHSFKS
jgi:hypothetical protein